MRKPKVVAVLPAYNAAKTLKSFWSRLPQKAFNQIILIDDFSQDQTYTLARSINGLTVFRNDQNLGYGGNMKRCLTQALGAGADIIVEIHPDGEYGVDGISPAIEAIKRGSKLVLGNRFEAGKPPGMYLWKYLPNRVLSWFDNLVLGTNIADIHQGFRVYSKKLIKKINYQKNSDDFLFTFQIICQAVNKKMKISCVAVSSRYQGKKRGVSFYNSLKYGLGSFWVLILLTLARKGYFKAKIFDSLD